MRTVTYRSVLEKASLLWTGKVEPDSEEAGELGVYINRRARRAWEAGWWRDVTVIERRQFRPTYATGEVLAAGDERYWVPTGKYYQCVKAQAVASEKPADSGGAVNDGWWAEVAEDYGATDWATGTVYGLGDQARNPADDVTYSCISAHTAGATFDGSKWGALQAWVRSLDPEEETAMGEVRRVWTADPAVFENAGYAAFDWMNGLLVVRGTAAVVWVELRKRVPSWSGEDWVGTATYGIGEQVWGGDDFYASLTAGNTGNPVSDASKWAVIEFPYVLVEAVAQGAYADAVRADGRQELYGIEAEESQLLLELALSEEERRGGTARRLAVGGRA
jgi:hypothetical protein